MERIKQELLDNGFMVHVHDRCGMEVLMGWLENNTSCHWGRDGTPTGNRCNWDRYKNQTVIKIGNIGLPQINYDSLDYFKKNYEQDKILSYDDIWEHCGGVVGLDDLWEFENGSVLHNTPVNINSVRGVSGGNIEQFMKELPLQANVGFMTKHSGIFTGGLKMRENTKVENRIEELEESIWKKELKLNELKIANKYSDMSMEISSELLLIDEEKKLLKGYKTLDNIGIGNVIINNETVIVISLYDDKAISRLSDGDEFNFLTGFFLCLTKLGSVIDTDFYDYSIHVALEDIEIGNL